MDIDVRRLAALAHIQIAEEEVEEFTRYLEGRLKAADTLPALAGGADSVAAPAASGSAVETMELRPDAVRPSSAREDILHNAPHVRAGCFAVPMAVYHEE